MNLKFINQKHKGWDRIWAAIENKFGSKLCTNPHNGETWQYMGSTPSGHEFRHRSLLIKPGDAATVRQYFVVLTEANDFDLITMAVPIREYECPDISKFDEVDWSKMPDDITYCNVTPREYVDAVIKHISSEPKLEPIAEPKFDFDRYNGIKKR